MGSLTVPTSGLVYLDTNPVIYSVEKNPRYWPLLEPVWPEAGSGRGGGFKSCGCLVFLELPRLACFWVHGH